MKVLGRFGRRGMLWMGGCAIRHRPTVGDGKKKEGVKSFRWASVILTIAYLVDLKREKKKPQKILGAPSKDYRSTHHASGVAWTRPAFVSGCVAKSYTHTHGRRASLPAPKSFIRLRLSVIVWPSRHAPVVIIAGVGAAGRRRAPFRLTQQRRN